MTRQVTADWLKSVGCTFTSYKTGSMTAFSENGYVVANNISGTWYLANKSKRQWKPVKLRIKATSQPKGQE